MKDGFIDKYYFRFFRAEKHKACVMSIHGLGGHSIWFDNAAKLFNEKSISHFSFDLPAFGQSKFLRGDINTYVDWIDACQQMFKYLLFDELVNVPIFILGHSMGSMLALCLSKKIHPRGYILSVPGFEGHKDSFSPKMIFSTLTTAVVKPADLITLPFGPDVLVRSRDMQQEMKRDDLRVISPSARLLLQVHLLTTKAKIVAKTFKESVLLLQAGQDKVCSNEAMERAFISMKSKDKTRKIYPEMYHDLFVESPLTQIVDDISEWVLNRVD